VGVFSTSKTIRNLKPLFLSYLATKGLSPGAHVKSLRSHLIPTGPDRKSVFGDERGMLVGDATGFADPLTGEGIFYAIRSAQIASDVIVESFLSDLEHMRDYNRLVRKAFVGDLTWAKGMAYVLYRLPMLGHRLLERYGEAVAEHQLKIICGKGAYSELWRKMFRRPLAGSKPLVGAERRVLNQDQ
jgi:flavin-dependent dehydrogenase